jgi:hypothetical protein
MYTGRVTLHDSDHGCFTEKKVHWIFLIMSTLQTKNYVGCSRCEYLMEEKLQWMFLIMGTLQRDITVDVSNSGSEYSNEQGPPCH